MTHEELKQAAIDYLRRAFLPTGSSPSPHVVQAAVSIILTPDPKP